MNYNLFFVQQIVDIPTWFRLIGESYCLGLTWDEHTPKINTLIHAAYPLISISVYNVHVLPGDYASLTFEMPQY